MVQARTVRSRARLGTCSSDAGAWCHAESKCTKSQPIFPSNPRSRISESGLWEFALDRNATDEWDIDEATKLLLAAVPASAQTWRSLAKECVVYSDIAASLTSDSSAFSLSAPLMASLAERCIEVRFDIYDKSVPSRDP